jgi:glutamate--cysteine ligase
MAIPFIRQILPNGLHVLVHEDRTTPLASCTIVYRVGSRDENPDCTGLAHLMEHFMSMGFFHFRVKKYIEIRVADSVPIEKALGYAALIKGIVYSDANLATLERILRNISGPEQIQEAVQSIMRFGWSAVIYNKGTVSEWAGYLLALAGNALPEKERGYLENVRIIRGDSQQEDIYQSIA